MITIRRLLLAALAAPVLSACVDVSNQTIGGPNPPGGAMFRTYVAIGTSISSGWQSNGINDSTQQQAFPVLLAKDMGLTPGASFAYPSFALPGCPPPYTNPLTGARVSGGSSTTCATRTTTSAASFMNNISIPGIRTVQVLNIDTVPYYSDTLKLSQFVTGGMSPIAMLQKAQPTFVTLEMGANDVLAAASRADTTIVTPLASFQAAFNAIADSIAAIPNVAVAVSNLPAWQAVPYFTQGQVFFCLNSGACPGIPATVPYSLASFTVDASCAPSAAGGVGDSTLVPFPATGAITSALAGGHTASLNCGTGAALANGVAVGPVVTVPKFRVILAVYDGIDTYVASQAASRGWAFVNLHDTYMGALAAGSIRSFPDFTKPTSTLFGAYMSLDGVHPNAAGHKMIANAFITAINTTYGTTLAVIP